jgi:hypothetical protein
VSDWFFSAAQDGSGLGSLAPARRSASPVIVFSLRPAGLVDGDVCRNSGEPTVPEVERVCRWPCTTNKQYGTARVPYILGKKKIWSFRWRRKGYVCPGSHRTEQSTIGVCQLVRRNIFVYFDQPLILGMISINHKDAPRTWAAPAAEIAHVAARPAAHAYSCDVADHVCTEPLQKKLIMHVSRSTYVTILLMDINSII